jgi:hypothetical protein
MSTVSKEIADRIIAGEFPEDGIYLIIRYENIFNGDYAYKLYYSYRKNLNLQQVVLEVLRIYGDNPMTYWLDEKKFTEKDVEIFKHLFPQVERKNNGPS